MSFARASRKALLSVGLVLIGFLIGSLLLAGSVGAPRAVAAVPAQAAALRLAADLAPAAPNALSDTFYTDECSMTQLWVYSTRVNITCNMTVPAPPHYQYFAIGVDDPQQAARVQSVLETAWSLGETVSIYYDASDTSGAGIGCGTSNCRLILAAGMP
jgi:hypothetical protein